jgi:hypothetical protein
MAAHGFGGASGAEMSARETVVAGFDDEAA